MNRTPGVVTVYGDLVCPFASLVLHRLRATRQRLGLDVRFDVRAFPLELVNRRPHALDLHEREKSAVQAAEPTLEWRAWRGTRDACPITTLLALEAVEAAKHPEVGGLDASDRLDAALRRAVDLDSRCIALLPVILEVAEEVPDMDRGALAAALLHGSARADLMAYAWLAEHGVVKGSPHAFTPDGREWLNAGFEVDHHRGEVTVTDRDPGVYEEILRAA
jgi:predicted DsbA family dithiol-disulfide isomerase